MKVVLASRAQLSVTRDVFVQKLTALYEQTFYVIFVPPLKATPVSPALTTQQW